MGVYLYGVGDIHTYTYIHSHMYVSTKYIYICKTIAYHYGNYGNAIMLS